MSEKERAARQEFERFWSRGGRYHMHAPTMSAASLEEGVISVAQRYRAMLEAAGLEKK